MGFLSFYDVRDRRAGPLRLVLRKSRAIPITVLDGKGQPLADAKIHADFHSFSPRVAPRQLIEQATDTQGKALFRVPSDMPLAYVFAVKAGAGSITSFTGVRKGSKGGLEFNARRRSIPFSGPPTTAGRSISC